tara:strand:+ start:24145 stop:25506 length:1362 start_codon:yes stop_codon:yes gene_type:complete
MVFIASQYNKFFEKFFDVYFKIPKNFKYALSFLIHATIFFSLFLSRPVVGIYIFGYRLGEFVVLFSLIISIFIFLAPTMYFQQFKKTNIIYIYKVIIFYFLITLILRETSITDSYTFKSSSYIWTVSFIFTGYYFLTKYNFEKISLIAFYAVLPSIYVISTGNYPNFVIDFFILYSDKFLFIKGSDLTIALVAGTTFIKITEKNEKLKFIYFISIVSIFLPLLLFNSRASFIAGVIYLILSIINFKEFIKNNILIFLITLMVSSALFIFSGYRVYGNFNFEKDPEVSRIQEVAKTLGGISEQKNTEDLLLFYFENGRLRSDDPTTEWRLDIWQDVIEDLSGKDLLLKGYGYKEIIPVMKDPSAPGRLGRDGLNENVHNYFINILARGGIPQVIFFLLFHILLIYTYFLKNKNLKILTYVIPLMLLANFDATMEGVNFPLIYYSFYGYFIKKGL